MLNLNDIIINLGDVIELNLPTWDLARTIKILDSNIGWKKYNPRKNINRKGLSVTSLDGEYGGVPDLDSLTEYNRENNTRFVDRDFTVKTDIVNKIPELNDILNVFDDHGRCHFIKLDMGGFFPPHRDNLSYDGIQTFRIVVPITGFDFKNAIWLQEHKPLFLVPGNAYFINTSKIHSLFSYVDGTYMFVMNVNASKKSIHTLASRLRTN